MTDFSRFTKLSDQQLNGWVFKRMLGYDHDPSLRAFEKPADYVILVMGEVHDQPLYPRFRRVVLEVLISVSQMRDLWWGPAGEALVNLSTIVREQRMSEAYPVLMKVIARGRAGGHERMLDPHAEAAVTEAIEAVKPEEPKKAPFSMDMVAAAII